MTMTWPGHLGSREVISSWRSGGSTALAFEVSALAARTQAITAPSNLTTCGPRRLFPLGELFAPAGGEVGVPPAFLFVSPPSLLDTCHGKLIILALIVVRTLVSFV